jgi:hypothetical protein
MKLIDMTEKDLSNLRGSKGMSYRYKVPIFREFVYRHKDRVESLRLW